MISRGLYAMICCVVCHCHCFLFQCMALPVDLIVEMFQVVHYLGDLEYHVNYFKFYCGVCF